MKPLMPFIIMALLQITIYSQAVSEISIISTSCENINNPLGIDVLNPHLSWKLESSYRNKMQSAYQILVSDSKKKSSKDIGNIWDTKKKNSSKSIQVKYEGESLTSKKMYYWKVRVWDEKGNISNWSSTAQWEMGLLEKNDWDAKWINDGKKGPKSKEEMYQEDPAPIFRHNFFIDNKVLKARLYITGVGYYEASINGKKVGESVLEPGWTNYSKRVLYNTFNVTELIKANNNSIGVMLGNGWYNPLPMTMFGKYNLREHLSIGRPQFIAQLIIDYTDGTSKTIVTNEDWKTTSGPILRNNIYLGEIYDARKEIPNWNLFNYDDSKWGNAKISNEKLGILQSQKQPPIKITAKLNPIKLSEPIKGVYIFDMGQNFAGWANLKVQAPAGTEINMRYGELLNEDGTLNVMTSVAGQIKGRHKNENLKGGPFAPDTAWQMDKYITSGKGIEYYTPRFTFHAFRYVEVSGLSQKPELNDIVGLRLNSNLKRSGSFECSNELFNKIQKITDWTFLSNVFSVQSDCPHRERFGYGGDLAVTTDAFIYNYDMSNFYEKVIRDYQDAVLPDGRLTDTAPFVGIDYCGIGWAFSHPLTLLELYQYYGNISLIEEQYATAQKWFDGIMANNDLIIKDGLSDHESLAPIPTSEMVTPLYYQSAVIMSKLATIIDSTDNAEKYQKLSEQIKKAYLEKFYNKGSGKFAPYTQASQAFATYTGIVQKDEIEKTVDELVKNIDKHNGHLTTGIFGTKYSLDVLSEYGHAEKAIEIVNQKSFPGWGHMIENGATTLWEHWEFSDNTFSHNHPMFGSVSEWFYKWIAGIQPDPSAVGFDKIIIRPQITPTIEWARGKYNSVFGKIVSEWKREEKKLYFNVTIPVNSKGIIYIPTSDVAKITENGKRLSEEKNIKLIKVENGNAVLKIGSGNYMFESEINEGN